jgi:acetylornithine deacetylase/succinyl-diaminopimelate desuccinylase-like protein
VITRMKLTRICLLAFLSSSALIGRAQQSQQSTMPPYHQLAHDIFQQLIEINTTDTPAGNVTTAAQAVAARLAKAGFSGDDLRLGGPLPNKYNVVARIHGSGKEKPVLFIGHLDVVQALKQDWSANLDPFKFNEIDGYFYGRGTSDIKQGDTILITNFIRLKQEGFVPDRDLILALTADEEGGESNGIQWLLKNHRDWIDAEYCINTDAGDFETENGKRLLLGVETSEKNYIDFQLEVKSKGGHSSRPVKDNAIYHLAAGLVRLSDFQFPVELNETTRSFFARTASLQDAQTAADFQALSAGQLDPAAVQRLSQTAYFNALLRTTCVATRLEGGHANNALPQTARAIVNCRMLPTDSAANVQKTLVGVLANPRITVQVVNDTGAAPPSAINPVIMRQLEELSAKLYGGIPVVPVMDAGASDGKYLRLGGIPTYGIPGVFEDVNDDRAHGRDERIGVKDFYAGVDFYYSFMKSLAGEPH